MAGSATWADFIKLLAEGFSSPHDKLQPDKAGKIENSSLALLRLRCLWLLDENTELALIKLEHASWHPGPHSVES
ncbi:MAG: hypothetical protein GY696_27075 [Gammaproteobacteria bacterium]|nr:hypothetical protein [Gammaproteobacteria bacterium]